MRRLLVVLAVASLVLAASPASASPVCIKDLKYVVICTPWVGGP